MSVVLKDPEDGDCLVLAVYETGLDLSFLVFVEDAVDDAGKHLVVLNYSQREDVGDRNRALENFSSGES